MKKIPLQYSKALLVDFDKLITDFRAFIPINPINSEKSSDANCQAKIQQLMNYSLDNHRILVNIFDHPVLANERKNKEKCMKNITKIIEFMYNYLTHSEQILAECHPGVFQDSISQIKRKYLDFSAKYLN